MKIYKLNVVNFRNYRQCTLEFPAMINVIYGQNAQGKTNLLEAMFYGSFGLSHRTNSEDELLHWNSSGMAVGIDYENITGNHSVRIKKYIELNKSKKDIFLDGVKIRPKEHYGSLNTVMFSPEDLQLIKGEPALRRRFFDMQISQTDSIYYDLLLKYNRVLQQRNKLLKDLRENGGKSTILDVWDQEFCNLAAKITQKRINALKKLESIASSIYASLTKNNEQITVSYEMKGNNSSLLYPKSCEECDSKLYYSLLKEREKVDILRGNTGIGPHRDDLQILLNGMSIKSFGSQGQQRTGALALKLSQLEYVYQEIGEFPILLLDDVMSELDNQRRAQLLLFIDGRVQTFITVNDKELIPELANNAYFKISSGAIEEA